MKKYVSAFFLFFYVLFINAQQTSYIEYHSDSFGSIGEINTIRNNNLLITASGASGLKMMYGKADSTGHFSWIKGINWSNQITSPAKAINLGDSSYCFAGSVTNVLNTYLASDLHVLRTDSSGNKIWAKNYGFSPGFEVITDGIVSADSTLIFCGLYHQTLSQSELFIFKIDLNGNVIWNRQFDGRFIHPKIVGCSDGNFYIASLFYDGNGLYDCKLVKFHKTGEILWAKKIVNLTSGTEFFFQKNNDVRFYMCWESDLGGNTECGVMSLDSSGAVQWANHYFASGFNYPRDFKIDKQGYPVFLAHGSTQQFNFELLGKCDTTTGNLLFANKSYTSDFFNFRKISPINSRIFISGSAQSSNHTFFSLTDIGGGNGCTMQTCAVNTTPANFNFIQDSISEIYYLFFNTIETSIPVNLSYSLTDSCSTTGIYSLTPLIEITLFPNPSNGELWLSGEFPQETKFDVYNMLGQIVFEKYISQGNKTEQLSLMLAEGIYTYRVVANGNNLKTGKIVIQH